MIQMLMEIRMLTEMRLERHETEVIRRDKVISLQAGAAAAVSEKNTNNTRIRRVQLISQYIMVSIWPEWLSTIIVNSPNIVARGSNIILTNTQWKQSWKCWRQEMRNFVVLWQNSWDRTEIVTMICDMWHNQTRPDECHRSRQCLFPSNSVCVWSSLVMSIVHMFRPAWLLYGSDGRRLYAMI